MLLKDLSVLPAAVVKHVLSFRIESYATVACCRCHETIFFMPPQQPRQLLQQKSFRLLSERHYCVDCLRNERP